MKKGVFIFLSLMILGHHQANANGVNFDALYCNRGRMTDGYHCHQSKYARINDEFQGRVIALDPSGVEPMNHKFIDKLPKPIQLSGKAHVSDGDTIRIGQTRVRLFGIDAPEIQQTCFVNGRIWDCGLKARQALVVAIGKWEVSCEEKDRDRYSRVVATCIAGGVNLNSLMVRAGWALAYRRYSNEFEQDESVARVGKLGLWQGTFIPPWDWRRSKRSGH